MTLIKSISGIRGTIGGPPGDGLTPVDIVKYASAFGAWVLQQSKKKTIVIGRDARPSGDMVSKLVTNTLMAMGIDVVDLGLSTTPTVEMAVPQEKAGGGIIITASHNPVDWNALKLLNSQGEFISAQDGKDVLQLAQNEDFDYAQVKKLGRYDQDNSYLLKHIQAILDLPLVDREAIEQAQLKIAVNGVNSSGGVAVPLLLQNLGVAHIGEFHCEPTGWFPHNPEPLPENMVQFCKEVDKGEYNLGIVVDPDVDRLAFVQEDGEPFGEEYTLVAVADYVLQQQSGNTVSNLSSTQALKDVTQKQGGSHFAAAVGEVHVVEKMKAHQAVIGGEGNGGIIYPKLHYGRDALVGIALFLSHLATSKMTASRLRGTYPNYFISKKKIELTDSIDIDNLLSGMQKRYEKHPQDTVDGLKIEFDKEWVHLRKSNTEPIIRIYSESDSMATAEHLGEKIIGDIKEIITDNH